MFKCIFFSLNLGSLLLVLSLTTTERPGSSLHHSIRFLHKSIRSLQAFPSWSLHSSLSLSLHGRDSNAVVIFVAPHWTHSNSLYLMSWSPEVPTVHNVWLHPCWAEGKDHLPQLTGNDFLHTALGPVGHLLLQGHTVGLCATYYPKRLLCKDSF